MRGAFSQLLKCYFITHGLSRSVTQWSPAVRGVCASKFGIVGFTRALAAELAGAVGVTMVVPGGMRTAFFDGREERYRPSPGARLNDPASVADAIVFALAQPEGCEVRELVVTPSTESSWPP